MKRRILCIIMLFAVLMSAVSCSAGGETDGTSDKVARILNSMEYTIYMNVFYSGQGDSYTDKTYTKEGVFAILRDSFNDVTRYYVWGYSDETLCCDWQWEFVPKNKEELPPIGSHVKVTGNFAANGNALDGYWMEDARVETISSYDAAIGECDLITMSSTLARVQIINMVNYPTEYNGQAVKVYGRVMSGGEIQHPYYDNAWSLPLEYEGDLPAIGTWITVTGSFRGSSEGDGSLIVESLESDS